MKRRRGPVVDDGDDEAYFNEETDSGSRAPGRAAMGRAFSRLAQPVGVPAQPQPTPLSADGEVDPLDAFMAEINKEVAKAPSSAARLAERYVKEQDAAARLALDETLDPAASYFEAFEQAEVMAGSDGEEYNNEDFDRRKKPIEPLPRVDHSQIRYNVVQTDFYKPHPEIEALDADDIQNLRKELSISATGSHVPSPAPSFAHLSHVLGKELMEGIRRHGYQQPTPIQAQAIPVALKGRDLIGVAETGSGKTVAYLLPLLVHTISQEKLEKDEGPISVVLCPTRELAVQIEKEVYKFNKLLGLRSVTLAGGLSKLEQFKEIKRGCEIAICNPGRLIDIVKMKGCNLRRVTLVVIDEADRMLHLGFEYQVRSIIQAVRPSRQTLFFSATFPPKVEHLARDLLQQPARITIGEAGQAASCVKQTVAVVKNNDEKWPWLSSRIEEILGKGQALIFVKSILSAEELTENFIEFLGKKTVTLHGDMDQGERMRILSAFRKQRVEVMIATDVAARGLDIPTIRTVVSYDVARDLETHTHRIGRTGRAGAAGEAYTLLTQDKEEWKIAAHLVEHLEQVNQTISDEHNNLALRHAPYRAAKLAGRKFEGKKKGAGLGRNSKQSSFGLGFDGQSMKKETVQDLEKRLNKEADRLVKTNRSLMAGRGLGRAHPSAGRGVAGFVAAATADEQKMVESTVPDDSSDEDLFAPGVTAAFGRPTKAAAPAAQAPTAQAPAAQVAAPQWSAAVVVQQTSYVGLSSSTFSLPRERSRSRDQGRMPRERSRSRDQGRRSRWS
mmetsp:Transcript_53969/g.94690  ORF Transcript_53969/g.94690 Transcript_53969/m.94690 type:complete len:785 (+) Transcript_53969:138-2492(+)